MKGRDTTILEKEKEITHLNRELRQMENSKYVFQHKIMVLQEEIKPKEEKIENSKELEFMQPMIQDTKKLK